MNRLRPILLIMLGVFAWGVVHAFGAYLMNHNPLRGLVVAAFTGGFLGFWGFLIYWKWDHLTGVSKRQNLAADPAANPSKQPQAENP